MAHRMYGALALALSVFTVSFLSAQEALKSAEEEYYDFLAVQGKAERGFLNYRTLSDSVWTLEGEAAEGSHVWAGNNLGTRFLLWQPAVPAENAFARGLDQGVTLRVYGPEWFNSFNTHAPYGQNDGGLWQGKGYNTSLSAGARLEAYGFELTVKPQLSFSQNAAFDYIQPNYPAVDSSGNPSVYDGKAAMYGYYGVTSVDAPQRFGNRAFWNFDWGDTEIRWSWHGLTVGFGTQAVWLGPAKLNPIMHSNNAASYPKFDIGLRKTAIIIPKAEWYLGDIEFRAWWGRLSESDWFDNDDNNDYNLISGVSFAWALPGILKGFSIGINRTMLSKWDNINQYTLFGMLVPNLSGNSAKGDISDQRMSFVFDYHLPSAGFEIYFEWGRNDYSPSKDYIVKYPFHTQGWTLGVTKIFNLPKELKLQLLLEITSLECSADYDRLISWYSTFYAHHIITQGYTNKGQWIGAGIGTGGNSQYLGARLYYKNGSTELFVQRQNPDLDYTMYIDSRKDPDNAEVNIRAKISIGISSRYFITDNIQIFGTYVFSDELNPLNQRPANGGITEHRFNNHLALSVKYNF